MFIAWTQGHGLKGAFKGRWTGLLRHWRVWYWSKWASIQTEGPRTAALNTVSANTDSCRTDVTSLQLANKQVLKHAPRASHLRYSLYRRKWQAMCIILKTHCRANGIFSWFTVDITGSLLDHYSFPESKSPSGPPQSDKKAAHNGCKRHRDTRNLHRKHLTEEPGLI